MGDCTSARDTSVKSIMTSSGFPQFTPDFEWKFYKSLVENYFAMNAVKDKKQQKVLFISNLPEELFKIVIRVLGLPGLTTVSMEEIFQQLDSYFQTKVPVSVQRFNFFRRDRREKESLTDYATTLRAMAESCEFGDSTNENLCTLFRGGLNQPSLQKLLDDFEANDFDVLVRRATALEFTILGDSGGDDDENKFIKAESVDVSVCDFKDMGCLFQGSVIEMERHLVSSSTKHVLLLSKNLIQNTKAQDEQSAHKLKFEQEVDFLKTVEAQNQQIAVLKQQIDALKQQNIDQKQKTNALEQQVNQIIDAQKTDIAAQEDKYKQLHSDVLALSNTGHVWCISGVADHCKASIRNPSFCVDRKFYTRKHGYHVRAVCFFNKENEKPYEVGLFLYLDPGTFDAILPWPFHQKVTFTLHQQSGGTTKDISKSYVSGPTTWKECKEPSTLEDSEGYGFPKFVTQDVLKKHYVKDDKVYITIMVEDPL